jgi:hypothetical protein
LTITNWLPPPLSAGVMKKRPDATHTNRAARNSRPKLMKTVLFRGERLLESVSVTGITALWLKTP